MTGCRYYEAFGRLIVADRSLPLTRIPSTEPHRETSQQDSIRVTRGGVPASPDGIERSLEQVYTDSSGNLEGYVDGDVCYWFDTAVGSLCVRRGHTVTVWTRTTGAMRALEQFIVGPGLRTAVAHQGAFVLHAGAVAIDGRAIVFLGPSGRGKSTAVAACAKCGHTVLADDAAAIACRSGEPVVLPSASRPAIDDETRRALERTIGTDESRRPTERMANGRQPVPLAAVLLLEDGDRFDRTTLSPPRGAFELLRATDTLVPDLDRSTLDARTATAGEIAGAVPVERVVRPRSLARMDTFVTRLEATVG
ncbi:hypothetical protein D8Y22_07980 [Salinadaptatus halalkaliphilus]|uniref:Serine kinase n=1 Tax=Salinadaptatus halalkaliphilus TaxID=2419781 RepID=A0A4S3TLV4_9EURY|nr:hypothetical protein [Salinadaptatus halalkaliphilus]THE65152.1 hypothetical protein D8Y22_07980 [Salinadaptatus halalkaliphilus]